MIDFITDFFQFLFTKKKYWLLPAFILFILIGFLIFFTQGTAIAPFIYTIF